MRQQQLTDKTGAPVAVTQEADRFVISVEDTKAALTMYVDHEGRRIFYHTEARDEFGGRGLASILIAEALAATRAEGLRIVPVCPLVARYVAKHDQYADVVDAPTPETLTWLRGHLG